MVVDARTLKRSGPPSPPPPVVPSKPWRPFTFSRLEKVSSHESRLTGRLKWVTPKAEAVEALCARLKAIFDAQAGFTLEALRVLGPGELRRHLAEPTFLAFLVPGPHRGRAVLEIELALAHAVVDMLLGGAGETVGLRPLTDIEEGVVSFVLLEALKALVPGMDPGQPKPRMEGVARGVDEAASRLGEEGPVLVVQLRARLGAQEGMVRLFVPSGVLEVMEPAQVADQRRAVLRDEVQAHLGRLSSARAWLRAEIGYAEISSQDLSGLRVKDVVLVDSLSARPDRGENGTARLRLGLGRVGSLNAEVFLENDQYQARITEVVLGEQSFQRRGPSESDEAAEEQFSNPEMNSRESGAVDDRMDAGDLLGDIPLQISVELARVPVTADQVVSMRVGQIVELNKAPGEPVDLSVNGKVVARGELVEVEGHLGVRILSLAG
jgi:flagellar motor switch protein FliM